MIIDDRFACHNTKIFTWTEIKRDFPNVCELIEALYPKGIQELYLKQFLDGLFYHSRLNKAIGINYLPQVFIDSCLNNKELNQSKHWQAGFEYCINSRFSPMQSKDIKELKSVQDKKQELKSNHFIFKP